VTYTFTWITSPLRHQQAVARRNAARATAICSERRRQREEVEAYLSAHHPAQRRADHSPGAATEPRRA
jgi:hypothetical protein